MQGKRGSDGDERRQTSKVHKNACKDFDLHSGDVHLASGSARRAYTYGSVKTEKVLTPASPRLNATQQQHGPHRCDP